jgi:hypothetical protein
MMIFDETSRKFPQTGSSCDSVTVNDRDTGPKLKWCIFDNFDAKSATLPQTGSSCISVTVNDRDTGPKLKFCTFDDFRRKIREITPDRKQQYLGNGEPGRQRTKTKMV